MRPQDLARALAIALAATLASLGSVLGLLLLMGSGVKLSSTGGLLAIAAAGNFLIGLPVALVTFSYLRRRGRLDRRHIFNAATISGMILMAAVTSPGGIFGFLFYGIPILFAAFVWAILGWHLIAKTAAQHRPDA